MKGKVYILRSNETDKFYIGSTKNRLGARLSIHKYQYRKYLDGEFNYVTSYEIVRYADCRIEILEEAEIESLADLKAMEEHHIRANWNDERLVNKGMPNRTQREYQAEYRAKNREALRQKQAEIRARRQ